MRDRNWKKGIKPPLVWTDTPTPFWEPEQESIKEDHQQKLLRSWRILNNPRISNQVRKSPYRRPWRNPNQNKPRKTLDEIRRKSRGLTVCWENRGADEAQPSEWATRLMWSYSVDTQSSSIGGNSQELFKLCPRHDATRLPHGGQLSAYKQLATEKRDQ